MASAISAVRIIEPGFRTAVRRGSGPVGFVFAPEGNRRPSAAEADEAVVTRIRSALYTDQVYHAVAAGDDLAVFVDPVGTMEEAMRIASELSAGLEAAGFSGAIRSAVGKLPQGWGHRAPTITSVLCCSEAAVDEDWLALRQLPKRVRKTRWAVGTDAFERLVDGVTAWAFAHYKSSLRVGSSFSFVSCRPEQVANIVSHFCAEIGDAKVVLETELGEIHIYFSLEGYLHVDVVLEPGHLSSSVDEQLRLIAKLAPELDYGFLTRAGSGAPSLAALLGGPPRYLSMQVAKVPLQDHSALKRSILDVFGFQILGPEHPNLQPDAAWRIWNLGQGKRLVGLSDPKGWFSPGGPPADRLHQLRAQNSEHFLVEFESYPV